MAGQRQETSADFRRKQNKNMSNQLDSRYLVRELRLQNPARLSVTGPSKSRFPNSKIFEEFQKCL